MPKIALIGAGSVVFTRDLVNDILIYPALADGTISLMDIDAERLGLARELVARVIAERNLPTRLEATLERREAIRDADYVIVTIQVGGLDAYAFDIEIPARYGVGQCIGDTLGPGGVFRALRTIPVLLDLCRDMDELAQPEALLINYSNPMAMNCWAIASTGRPHVGLCHSVQGTAQLLAGWINAPIDEISYTVAGINHMAWFLEFRRNGQDAYPLLRERIQDPQIAGQEPVRTEIMKQFGYFVTESSGHASEYQPYFRKSPQMIDRLHERFTSPEDDWFDWGNTGGYLKHCRQTLPTYLDEVRAQVRGEISVARDLSGEYAAPIMNAIETHRPFTFNGNVPNTELITNLPVGCCVEVLCLADARGIHPTVVGDLPPQLAALDRTNISVQELTVRAALEGNAEAVYHAIMLDPLTAAVCTLDDIRHMTDELFNAEAPWLPQFQKEATAPIRSLQAD